MLIQSTSQKGQAEVLVEYQILLLCLQCLFVFLFLSIIPSINPLYVLSISTGNYSRLWQKIDNWSLGISLFIFIINQMSGRGKTQGQQCDIWDLIIQAIN